MSREVEFIVDRNLENCNDEVVRQKPRRDSYNANRKHKVNSRKAYFLCNERFDYD